MCWAVTNATRRTHMVQVLGHHRIVVRCVRRRVSQVDTANMLIQTILSLGQRGPHFTSGHVPDNAPKVRPHVDGESLDN